ncbi:unnamed protein product [Aphanomyces euteiches]
MYGSLVTATPQAGKTSQLVQVASLVVSIAVLIAVVYITYLTNEIVSVLRPANQQVLPPLISKHSEIASVASSRSPHILVVHAGNEDLRQFGDEVARGASTLTSNVRVLSPWNASFDDVLWADGILLGSNVFNANVDPVLMDWINKWDIRADLSSKVAGAFAVAGGLSSGEETTLLHILQSMMVMRLVVVGGASWTSAFGASAIVGEGPFASSAGSHRLPAVCYRGNGSIPSLFLDKAFGLGRRVTQVAAKLLMA